MHFDRVCVSSALRMASTLALIITLENPKIAAQSNIIKSPILPNGLGLGVHFTNPQPGEIDLLTKTGSRIVRTDLLWHKTEKKEGEYDFSTYDRLIEELAQRNIQTLFILDYTNPLYDKGLAPYTEAGRQAFTRWAAAAVQHFKGHNIIWEMWNEPNLKVFWKPQPNVDNYTKLALSVGKVIRSIDPNVVYIGPATLRFDFQFLEACFKAGLLDYWSGVSVHPYRDIDIESVDKDYRKLRLLIAKYAPKDKLVPIISSEWGYSSLLQSGVQQKEKKVEPKSFLVSVNENTQSKLLSRQWLHNLANDIPISIWYEWHDNGPSLLNRQHHFGIVRYPYLHNLSQAYMPKPAYSAVATLTKNLTGFQFNKRLNTGNAQDYVLLFSNPRNQNVRLVVWTTSPSPHLIQIPVSPGRFNLISNTGSNTMLDNSTHILSVKVTDSPQYIIPIKPNDLLQIASAWERLPLEIVQPIQSDMNVTLSLRNPLPQPIQVSNSSRLVTIHPSQTMLLNQRVKIPSQTDVSSVDLELNIHKMGVLKQNTFIIDNQPWTGKNQTLSNTVNQSIEIEKNVNKSSTNSFQLIPGGDPNVTSTQFLDVVTLSTKSSPYPSKYALKITYKFSNGWKFIRLVVPKKSAAKLINGKPQYMGIWVHGDNSGNLASVRVIDATHQVFQSPLQAINWKGWRYITFPINGITSNSWSGANDGIIHYPIQLDSMFTIVSAKSQKTQGEIYVGNFNYIR